MNIFHSPSEQFINAVDHCRSDFAETKGVTRNAIDQRFAGNTHDPYPPFRAEFKDICATANANPDAYLTDLQSIKQRFRPVAQKGVCEAFLDKADECYSLLQFCTKALADGAVDKRECREILNRIGRLEEKVNDLKDAVIKQHNVLNGSVLPDSIKRKANIRRVR